MSPREPDMLAEWLQARLDEGNPDLPPPGRLDPAVVEAVDALRPDLVPLPPGGLEAVLLELVEGPLASPISQEEEEQAQALAEALSSPEPVDPHALGPDAYAALAALRPEALPVPALGAEDLAASVPTAEVRAGFPVGQARPDRAEPPLSSSVVAAPSFPKPANQRRWLLPGLTALAMAAVVMVVVVPAGPGLLQQESPFATHTESLDHTAPPADFAAEEAADAPRGSPLPSADAPAPTPPPEEDGGLRAAEQRASSVASARTARPKAAPAARSAPMEYRRVQSPPPATVPQAAQASPSSGVSATPLPAEDPSVALLGTRGSHAEPFTDDRFSAGTLEENIGEEAIAAEAPAPFAGGVLEPTPEEGLEPEALPPTDTEDGAATAEAVGPAPAVGTPLEGEVDRGLRSIRNRRKRLEREVGTTAHSGVPDDEDLASLRRKAQALVAPARPTPRSPGEVAAYAALDAARTQEDQQAQRAALRSLGASVQPAVVADAHLQLAALARERGETGQALAFVARGLGTPGVRGAWRSALLAAQGSLLEERGDPEGAMRSYRRALAVR